MTPGAVVSNSSPLIALERIRKLELLERLFGQIAIPPAVAEELGASFAAPLWIRVQPVKQPAELAPPPSLGPGEREAILLASQVKTRLLILDDRPARRFASLLGLPVAGTLAIIMEAKTRGIEPAVAPLLNELIRQELRISAALQREVLRIAGEVQ